MSWLMVFRNHRDLFEQCLVERARVKELEWLEREYLLVKKQYDETYTENQQLKALLLTKPPDANHEAWIKDFTERVLQEAPFPDGKVPEHLYLTPEVE